MLDQTEAWSEESYRYITSVLKNDEKTKLLEEDYPRLLKKFLPDNYLPNRILDVGCGDGTFLKALVNMFNAAEGVGIEPSKEGINLVKKMQSDKKLSFFAGFAHEIPFKNEAFDLVTVWGVLCWIDRNKYLQSLGELIRITSKYIAIMDFSPSKDYKVKYHHKEGYYTYKQNFELPLLSSGILKKIGEIRWRWNETANPIKDSDLNPFDGNSANWDTRKLVIFEKNKDMLPTYDQSFFEI